MVVAVRWKPSLKPPDMASRLSPCPTTTERLLELDPSELHIGAGHDSDREEVPLPFINLRRGIDIYAHWSGKTAAEERAQINGLSVEHGHVGYLREAYDGEPYATRELVPEAFEAEAEISAALLRTRLADTLRVAANRQTHLYHEEADAEATKAVLKSFADFVELCERKEAETGKPCRIVARY